MCGSLVVSTDVVGVRVSVEHGTVRSSQISVPTHKATLSGTYTAMQDAVQTLLYSAAADYYGMDAVVVNATLANQTASAVVLLYVNPIPIVVSFPSALAVDEDASVPISVTLSSGGTPLRS